MWIPKQPPSIQAELLQSRISHLKIYLYLFVVSFQKFAVVTRAAAPVSPSEGEYEYIMGRVRELMEEGRGETIMELGQGEDTEGITDEEMAASVATLK